MKYKSTHYKLISDLMHLPIENIELLQLFLHWENNIEITTIPSEGNIESILIEFSLNVDNEFINYIYLSSGVTWLPNKIIDKINNRHCILRVQTPHITETLLSRYHLTEIGSNLIFTFNNPSVLKSNDGILTDVMSLSVKEAINRGLGERWHWDYLVGHQSGVDKPVQCILCDDHPVAWAIAGMPTITHEEVRSVYVQPDFRKRGLGGKVVLMACKKIIECGRIPVYKTESNNAISIKLANSLGMEYVLRVSLLVKKYKL